MSIRLRLTIIYTTILALTLIISNGIIFFSQAQSTLQEHKMQLERTSDRIIQNRHMTMWMDHLPPPPEPLRPRDFQNNLYVQVRSMNGDIIQSIPNDTELIVFPLSDKGFQAIQKGKIWLEKTSVNGQVFLVQSQQVTIDNSQTGFIQIASPLIERNRYLSTLGQILIVSSLIAEIFAFGVGWLLAGITLRPIDKITQTAESIGKDHDFGKRVDYIGPKDEIGRLAITFNTMLAELQTTYHQLEVSLKTQQRFVADASHELRTPLTTIRGNLGLLQREPPISREDQTDVLADMVSETERVMRLVNNLLTLARADIGQSLAMEPVPIRILIEDVYRQAKILAPQHVFTCNSNTNAKIMANPDALKQILLVLIDNAIKYTPEGNIITLSSIVVNSHVIIAIQDTGSGIKPEILPFIFDRFFRGDSMRTGSGAGLGLSIAKELIEIQHGTITVASIPSKGSIFTLTFDLLP